MNAALLFFDLADRGVVLAVQSDKLVIDAPKDSMRPDEIEEIRESKRELLTLLSDPVKLASAIARHCEDTRTDVALFLDRQPQLGVQMERLGDLTGSTPAYSIVTTCQRHGVVLSFDENGKLVFGKAGAKADEPTQPWPTLIMALEAHLDDVAALVKAGWTLKAEFPKYAAA